MSTLLIGGSLRVESVDEAVLRTAQRLAPEGVAAHLYASLGALPGAFKNLLDRTVGGGEMDRRPVAWISTAGPAAPSGGEDAHASLRRVLGHLGAETAKGACARIPVARGAVGADGLVEDEAARAKIAAVLDALLSHARPSRLLHKDRCPEPWGPVVAGNPLNPWASRGLAAGARAPGTMSVFWATAMRQWPSSSTTTKSRMPRRAGKGPPPGTSMPVSSHVKRTAFTPAGPTSWTEDTWPVSRLSRNIVACVASWAALISARLRYHRPTTLTKLASSVNRAAKSSMSWRLQASAKAAATPAGLLVSIMVAAPPGCAAQGPMPRRPACVRPSLQAPRRPRDRLVRGLDIALVTGIRPRAEARPSREGAHGPSRGGPVKPSRSRPAGAEDGS